MSEFKEISNAEALNLEILRLVMSDRAAAQKAIEFVSGNQLKLELLKDQYQIAGTEPTPLGRVEKAIRNVNESLDLFHGVNNAGS